MSLWSLCTFQLVKLAARLRTENCILGSNYFSQNRSHHDVESSGQTTAKELTDRTTSDLSGPRTNSPQEPRQSLPGSSRALPRVQPITSGFHVKPHHLHGKLYYAHHFIQIPVYFIKWVMGQFLAMYAILFWRRPNSDEDIIKVVEQTSLIFVLHRDFEAEGMEQSSCVTPAACTMEGNAPLLEVRHYYVDVKRCELDMLIRDPWTTYKSGKGKSTLLNSWSMRYTKSRRSEALKDDVICGAGTNGGTPKHNPWVGKISSFVINGQIIHDRGQMMALLFLYNSTGTHTKSHVMGNALVDRILVDDGVSDKLAESTWTTTALHYGLLYGSLGPMTHPRHRMNQWMGLGAISTADSVVAEAENMSALGPDHGRKSRWSELQLPFAEYLLNARLALARAMKSSGIPLDLHEALFLSCIMHSTDHIQLHRVYWGILYNPEVLGTPGTWYDHYESVCWRYMWAEPTLNPLWNNKIRGIRKPFYRELYLGLKEVDTFNVADYITASIMY